MAGATNRALKSAGIPRGAIKELRVTGGRGLTLRSAISLAGERGIAIGDKPKAFLAKRDAKNKPAEDGAKRLADYRSAAEGYQRASDDGKRANRTAIREQMKRLGDLSRGVANSGSGSAEGAAYRDARAALSGMLRTRDGIAKARKAERTPGQMDLFGVQQPKRAESPFDRKMAEKRAREEGAKRFVPVVSALSKQVRAARQTAAKNTAQENRAAMVGARLMERLRSGLAGRLDARVERASDRFERVMAKYPGARQLAKQLTGERTLESRQAIQRMMRTSMGSASRSGVGLPATRSERIAGLLSSMKAREARMSAIKAAAKGGPKKAGGRQRRAAA